MIGWRGSRDAGRDRVYRSRSEREPGGRGDVGTTDARVPDVLCHYNSSYYVVTGSRRRIPRNFKYGSTSSSFSNVIHVHQPHHLICWSTWCLTDLLAVLLEPELNIFWIVSQEFYFNIINTMWKRSRGRCLVRYIDKINNPLTNVKNVSESIRNTGNREFWRNISNQSNIIAWKSWRSKSNNEIKKNSMWMHTYTCTHLHIYKIG